MSRSIRVTALMLVATAATASAQQPLPKMQEDAPGLLAQAKISPDSATKLALAKVPGGMIMERGIEKEKGTLLYSFDMKVKGKSGIEEVQINALTGAVIGVEHETPKAERAERKADAAKSAKPAAKPH